MPTCFRIEEVGSEAEQHQNDDKDQVVFPSDGLKGDRVDECVEEDGEDGGYPGDGEAAGSEPVGPDLAGVCGEEGGTRKILEMRG